MKLSRPVILLVALLALASARGLDGVAAPDGTTVAVPSAPVPASIADIRKLIAEGHYADAEKVARGLLAEVEQKTGCDSVETAEVLDGLVEALVRRGGPGRAEALVLVDRAIDIKERALGPEDPRLADSLVLKGRLLGNRGKYAEGRPLLERALALRVNAYGPDDVRVARAHSALGSLLYESDADSSEKHRREALRIFEVAAGPDSTEVADSLNGLANHAADQGRFAEAEDLYRRALRIFETLFGPIHPGVAQAYHNLGYLHVDTGEYEKARDELEQALAIREKLYGPEHYSVVTTLGNLAIVDALLGLPSAGRWEQAIALADKVLGPEHDVSAGMRANYALNLKGTDPERARQLAEEALAVFTRTFGPAHNRTLGVLGVLGDVATSVGDDALAERYYEQALEGWEKAPGEHQRLIAGAMENLAASRAESGRFAEARSLYERALALVEETYGPAHPEVGQALFGYASFRRRTGDLDGAHVALTRALTVREKALGESHPAVAATLFALGDLEAAEGKLAVATALLRRALAIQEKVRTPDDPANADGLLKVASCHLQSGRPREALDAALRAESISRRHLRTTLAGLPERQALGLVRKTPSGLDLAVSAAVALGDRESASKVLDAFVASRALVLDEMGQRHRTAWASRDPNLSALMQQYAAARARLANLALQGEEEKFPEKLRRRLEAARAAKEAAERALVEGSADFRRDRVQAAARLGDVRESLPAGSALVALVRYARHRAVQASSRDGKPRSAVASYAAFVLRKGEQAPSLVSLGPAAAIDAEVEASRKLLSDGTAASSAVSRSAEAACRRAGEALRRRAWDPLSGRLAGVRTVFVVPDGAFQLVSFAALPVGEDAYLAEKGPRIHYLSAERDLLPPETRPGRGILAAGGPDYDAPLSLGARRLEAAPQSLVAAADARPLYRGGRPKCSGFDSLRFPPLPSAGVEIREAAAAWSEAMATGRRPGPRAERVEPLVLTGPEATEEAFKIAAPGREILHVATHGYLLSDCSPAAFGPSATGQAGGRPKVFSENPLLLSGLAFAGANQRASAGPDTGDGILTAEEIAAMDLSGVDWAVLSACDTGAGEIRSGEGLFGLRRAFQVAGTRTLVLSFWPVEDEASRLWMKALYRNRLVLGRTTVDAVNEAALERLRERRAAGLSTHPFFWAGFVATGDWR